MKTYEVTIFPYNTHISNPRIKAERAIHIATDVDSRIDFYIGAEIVASYPAQSIAYRLIDDSSKPY